jgi:hypothetical protein
MRFSVHLCQRKFLNTKLRFSIHVSHPSFFPSLVSKSYVSCFCHDRSFPVLLFHRHFEKLKKKERPYVDTNKNRTQTPWSTVTSLHIRINFPPTILRRHLKLRLNILIKPHLLQPHGEVSRDTRNTSTGIHDDRI